MTKYKSPETKAKDAERGRKWREKNRDYYNKSMKERRLKLLEEFRNFKKTLSCIICKESHPHCLDFHHLIPSEKTYLINEYAGLFTMKKLSQELAKCIVLCSNCHKKFHAGDLQLPENPPRANATLKF